MANLLIRSVPAKTIRMAKKLAKRNRRSLQNELRSLLIQALELRTGSWLQETSRIKDEISRSGIRQSDSTVLLRQDRRR